VNAVPWLQCIVWRGPPRAVLGRSFAGGEEKGYFAPNDATKRGSEPRRGADLRECRDLQGSGGVAPKRRVAAETGLESILSSRMFRGESNKTSTGVFGHLRSDSGNA
jgi:hypothetical protein